MNKMKREKNPVKSRLTHHLACVSLPLLVGLTGLPGLKMGCGEDPGEYNIEKVTLIGILSEQSVPVCTGGQDYGWVDPHLEVGFTRIYPTGQIPGRLINGPVIVTGWKNPGDPPDPPRATGACPPPAQMRDDWLPGVEGFRIRRALPQAVTDLNPMAVETVKPFDGLKLQRKGEELETGLHNELGLMLSGLELQAHYEGCAGKPASHTITRSFAWLAPGATAQATFPGHLNLTADPAGRYEYALRSIQIVSSNRDVLFDFDRVLSEQALYFDCQKR